MSANSVREALKPTVPVGDVVADHVQVLAGGVQAREALLETHGVFLIGQGGREWR